jgi:hypothetical protein
MWNPLCYSSKLHPREMRASLCFRTTATCKCFLLKEPEDTSNGCASGSNLWLKRKASTARDIWASSHEIPRLFAGWLRIVCIQVSGLAIPCKKSHTQDASGKRFYVKHRGRMLCAKLQSEPNNLRQILKLLAMNWTTSCEFLHIWGVTPLQFLQLNIKKLLIIF